jgi:hypothetical protein
MLVIQWDSAPENHKSPPNVPNDRKWKPGDRHGMGSDFGDSEQQSFVSQSYLGIRKVEAGNAWDAFSIAR